MDWGATPFDTATRETLPGSLPASRSAARIVVNTDCQRAASQEVAAGCAGIA